MRSFYDLTYEEDVKELAGFIKEELKRAKTISPDTTVLLTEDKDEVALSLDKFADALGCRRETVDFSRWDRELAAEFVCDGVRARLSFRRVEEGAFKLLIEVST